MNLTSVLFGPCPEFFQIEVVVSLVSEDRRAVITALDHMLRVAGKGKSRKPGHACASLLAEAIHRIITQQSVSIETDPIVPGAQDTIGNKRDSTLIWPSRPQALTASTNRRSLRGWTRITSYSA